MKTPGKSSYKPSTTGRGGNREDPIWDHALTLMFQTIPKACRCKEFRPIMILPILQKVYEACLARLDAPAVEAVDSWQVGFRPHCRAEYEILALRTALGRADEYKAPASC